MIEAVEPAAVRARIIAPENPSAYYPNASLRLGDTFAASDLLTYSPVHFAAGAGGPAAPGGGAAGGGGPPGPPGPNVGGLRLSSFARAVRNERIASASSTFKTCS